MLSIIVPVYNVDKYLDACLLSIERQTCKDFEVIVVNDGSTDNSKQIALEYCKRNHNFFYFEKENGGLMSAYLFGIKKSKGDYIGFVDSDDYVEHDYVEKMYEFNKEKAEIVICERYECSEKGERIETNSNNVVPYGFYDSANSNVIYDNILPPFSGQHISNARWNKIFKREIVFQNLIYCESKSRIMEDRFFTPSCMFGAKTFKVINNKLYNYRQRKTGSNHSMPSPHLYESIKLLMKTQKQMLIDKGFYDKYESKYEVACLNYLSLYIQRNLLIKTDFKTKMLYSKYVVNDLKLKTYVRKHKKELKHKKGFAIKISYFFNSPFLLSLFSLFYIKK